MHINGVRTSAALCIASLLLSIACGSEDSPSAGPGAAGSAGPGAAGSAGSAGSAGTAAAAPHEPEAGAEGSPIPELPELGEAGAPNAPHDPELESAADQQATIDRTKAMPEPKGGNSTADRVVQDIIDGNDEATATTTYYDCAQQAAVQAYPASRTGVNICRYQPSSASLTSKLLVASAHDSLLISFAGTQLSFEDPEDLVRDFESQIALPHENPLFEHTDVTSDLLPTDLLANSGGNVGRGWEARWRGQLKEANAGNLYAILKQLSSHEAYAAGADRTLVVTVVGHSLGAVVAELAAYDIHDYLRAKGTRFQVRVIAFNPPKIGSSEFVDGYRFRLLNSADERRFEISQFSRSFDPVPQVPLFLSHPVWNNRNGSHVVGGGSDEVLPYCPQYAVDLPQLPLPAHGMGAWAADIAAMPSEAQCLFGSPLSASDF